MDDLYREEILDHYQNPRHFASKITPTNLKKGISSINLTNASCGDEIHLSLQVSVSPRTQIIKDIKFSGHGCAISIAFTSLLIEKILSNSYTLKNLQQSTEEDLVDLVGGATVSPARQKCLKLGIKALIQAASQLSPTK